ncbi:MAG: hypothetical protein OEX22_10125 [Cyclobacteriaceae bacterium]|nr:hypothetical protein [Cyclobacteriaceae bacterium]
MKEPILFFAIIVFVIFSVVLMFTNFNTPPQQLNEIILSDSNDECFEDTMETWFIEFNETQENGASMTEADEKASLLAIASFNDCHEEED